MQGQTISHGEVQSLWSYLTWESLVFAVKPPCQSDSHQLFFLFPSCCYQNPEESAYDQVLLWSSVYVKTEISKLKNWAPWVWQRIQLQPMEFSSQSWGYTTSFSRPFWHGTISSSALSPRCLAFLQVLSGVKWVIFKQPVPLLQLMERHPQWAEPQLSAWHSIQQLGCFSIPQRAHGFTAVIVFLGY